MQKLKTQNGITLIALIITIIVMLILVGVSVTVALNGGLFGIAKQAANETATEKNKEHTLSKGEIIIDGNKYLSYQDYLDNKPIPEGWELIETPAEWTKIDGTINDKIRALKEVSTEKVIPIPNGFNISNVETEQKTDTGLVITDGQNEFVWIPVSRDLSDSYSYQSFGEPRVLTTTSSGVVCDSQAALDRYYGTDYYNYEEDFNYEEEYAEMVVSVNKYDGFYIGRYETTMDNEGNVGSKYNTKVLTADQVLKQTNDKKCRWYGLYYLEKNANVSGNKEIVQTSMMYGILWDKTMEYIRTQKTAGYTTYDVDTLTEAWHGETNGHTGIVNSAQANEGDVALNIWDLESNATEWTQEAYAAYYRVRRGGYSYGTSESPTGVVCASARSSGYGESYFDYDFYASRIAMYIK